MTTTATPASDAPDFIPAPVRERHDGWTAQRQRIFLTTLAETGSISTACQQAGVSSRSAYRLRARPDATDFSRAWTLALEVAASRLVTLAFERATRGSVREVWRNGELVTQSRAPSDKLLIFLIQRLLDENLGAHGTAGMRVPGQTDSRGYFAAGLAALTDTPASIAHEPETSLETSVVHPARTERYT